MKINDKHLCEIAIGSTPTEKQGFLNKRGELNRSYQRRWCVLKGNLLFYFERPNDREPIGVVVLDNCAVGPLECDDQYAFQLSFAGTGARTYVLSASSQEEMEDWLRALTCANYDYIRAAVAQLQRQLDELNSAASSMSRSLEARAINESVNRSRMDAAASAASSFALPKAECSNTSSDLLVDLSDLQVTSSSRSRNFDEMHRDFGRYIQQMTSTSSFSHITGSSLLE